MRMDPGGGQSAADWLANVEEAELARVLKELGEERFARRIARAIVNARRDGPIQRTAHLAEIISAANPKWEPHKHPATRSFQAIRLHINSELESLQDALSAALSVLAKGGRLVVISFHSLEDRIVKRFIRTASRGRQILRGCLSASRSNRSASSQSVKLSCHLKLRWRLTLGPGRRSCE